MRSHSFFGSPFGIQALSYPDIRTELNDTASAQISGQLFHSNKLRNKVIYT